MTIRREPVTKTQEELIYYCDRCGEKIGDERSVGVAGITVKNVLSGQCARDERTFDACHECRKQIYRDFKDQFFLQWEEDQKKTAPLERKARQK